VAPGSGPAAAGISRTETRTECSECGISTTVPFKPTQGRPVLCRQCFKNKRPAAATPETVAAAPAEPAATVPIDPVVPVADQVQPRASMNAVAAQPSQV